MEDQREYSTTNSEKRMRYFHVAFQTRGTVGYIAGPFERFPNMDEMAKKAGVSADNFSVTSIYEFGSVGDYEEFARENVEAA